MRKVTVASFSHFPRGHHQSSESLLDEEARHGAPTQIKFFLFAWTDSIIKYPIWCRRSFMESVSDSKYCRKFHNLETQENVAMRFLTFRTNNSCRSRP